MAVTTQYATATADADGDAVFMFPDVPVGQQWIGTVTIPTAPASAVGTINVGGSPVGPLFGPGIYGPYIADYTRALSLSVAGLTPDTQYSAVWHADDQGIQFTTWPGTVTTTVEGTVIIPVPVEIEGTVTADQGGDWYVGTLTTDDPVTGQATWTSGGDVQMTATSLPVTNGVLVRGLKANTDPVYVGAAGVTSGDGYELAPGEATSFTCKNANLLYFIGQHSGDGVCFSVL